MQLSPTQADIDYWVSTFLPPKDLYYLDAGYDAPSDPRVEILSVTELLVHPEYSALDYNNAYELWSLDENRVHTVMAAEPSWFPELPMQERARLFGLQVALGRGLVFDNDVLRGKAFQKMIQHAGVNGGLVLNHFLWGRMDLNIRQQTTQRIARSWEDDWDVEVCPQDVPEHIQGVANTWVHIEGANCFGLTLFAITGDPDYLQRWVQQAEFLKVIEAKCYAPGADAPGNFGDLFLFPGSSGVLAHAAFSLGKGLVLNKSGQVKYQPVRVIQEGKLRSEWADHQIVRWSRKG